MLYKHVDFNAAHCATLSEDAFLKEHSGHGLDADELKKVHKLCMDEQGVKPRKANEKPAQQNDPNEVVK